MKKSFLLSKNFNDKQVCHFETEICFVRDFLLKRKQITDLTGLCTVALCNNRRTL